MNLFSAKSKTSLYINIYKLVLLFIICFFTYINLSVLYSCILSKNYFANYPNKLSSIPAATADPITPATLGPIACIRLNFPGFSD